MGRISYLKQRLLSSSLFKDSFWAVLGSALGKGLSLIAGIVVARFLGKDVYGEYGMIKTNLIMIATFSTFGLGYTSTKFISECKESAQNKIYFIHRYASTLTVVFSLFLAALVFIFAKPLAVYLEGEHLYNILRISSIAILFNAVTTTQIGELSGFGEYRRIAINNTISGIITFISSVLLVYLWGIEGASIALVISYGTNCLINWFSLKKLISESASLPHTEIKKIKKDIFDFSLPVALQESLYSITHWLGIVVLIKLSNYGEVGLMTAATQWSAILLFIPGALRNVALSHLSGNHHDSESNLSTLHRLVQTNLFCTVVPFFVVLLFSNFICSWYGVSYDGLRIVLIVSLLSSIFSSVSNVYTQELMALNMNWYLFFGRLFRDVLSIIFTAIAICLFSNGALMYCISTAFFEMLYLLTLIYKIRISFNGQK